MRRRGQAWIGGAALAAAAFFAPARGQDAPAPPADLTVVPPAATSAARPQPASAETPASLVADSVTYDRDGRTLTASGNVEVLYQGRVLRASRIIYDEAAGEVRAEGPITLTDPAGGVMLADKATLTPDLEDGLISGARLLIAGQMQLAAVEVRRTGGRYATLQRVIASSCTICAENPTPTWALRASRVTEDAVERRIYFENARLEMFGVPVALLPRLSIPEPGVDRATGFLVPIYRQSDIYGFGIKVPYYRTLGASADATVTPFVTTQGGILLEGEYRQRFDNGVFDIGGSVAVTNSLEEDAGRGFITATGDYRLRGGFLAQFDFSVASDDNFMAQYDYSDADKLTSMAWISRTLADEYVELGTVAFQSLREDEDTAEIPFIFPEFYYRRLFDTPAIGGRLGVGGDALGVLRHSGINMVRGGGVLDWQQQLMLPYGFVTETTALGALEIYRVWEDDEQPREMLVRATPTASATVRWPWVRSTGGADHVIEPIVQVAYSHEFGDTDNPNEDSQLPEFDATNLFSLNRFPGLDRLETGLRANVGINYTRVDPAGWQARVTVGRVYRESPEPDFPEGAGLAGRYSDYVGAVALDFTSGLSLINRSLFDPEFDFRRNEFAMVYDSERAGLAASYVYLAQDDSNPILGPQPETNEFSIGARYRVLPNWEVRGSWRYDLTTNSNLRAGAGITYGNECAEFDLSVSRRYTSWGNLPPSTSFGFDVRLAGLGTNQERDWPPRVCMARSG